MPLYQFSISINALIYVNILNSTTFESIFFVLFISTGLFVFFVFFLTISTSLPLYLPLLHYVFDAATSTVTTCTTAPAAIVAAAVAPVESHT